MTASDIQIMKDEDMELAAVMKGKFKDVSGKPVAKPVKAEIKKVEDTADEWVDEGKQFMSKLQEAVKTLSVFAVIGCGCFWGVMSGNMSGEMAWPIIYGCTAVGCFLAGRKLR